MFKAVCIVFSLLLLVLCLFWRVRLAQTEERIAALEDAIEKAEKRKQKKQESRLPKLAEFLRKGGAGNG